ncbi:MAG TPA: octaprenyl diphosphate synthase [Nitrospiraceae bacterium]|jgi:octaprenyl-diphosphate synthase|nr:octaprenyl diphosphate synthase [Nitrospiraceae bacterium]
MKCDNIFSLYAEDLDRVEKSLRAIFASEALIIPVIGEHIIRGGGKRLRPLFLILSADLANYRGENRIILAGIVEAIHTASLLHDDVVDEAQVRRGKPASHVLWGNQVAILVGDYIYATALRISVLQDDLRIIEALSGAIAAMTEGEIMQLNKVADPEITLDEYYRIISSKTGALISAACRIGGILGRLPREEEDALSRFGMKTGIAFQIADDVLDYMADERGLGKKLGKDLEEGKITLPLIYLLKVASSEEKEEVKRIIKSDLFGTDDLMRITELFGKYRAIEESLRIAQGLLNEAKEELTVFSDLPERKSLLMLAEYALARQR